MDLILVRQTIYAEGFECTVTELIPTYPRFPKCPAPFVRVIALPGTHEKASGGGRALRDRITAIAGEPSRTRPGAASARGDGLQRG